MIDPLQAKLAALYVAADEVKLRDIIEACDELNTRLIDLERRLRSLSTVINELVGRANE